MDAASTFLSPFFAALFGSAFTLAAAMWLQRRNARQDVTRSFINEFFSDAFLHHRIVVSAFQRKIKDGQVSIEDVAKAYWYPGIEGAYTGETIGEFNEHQHLTAYLGFLVRLTYSYKKGQIKAELIASALRADYRWYGKLLTNLAKTVQYQVAQHPGAESPLWVEAVFTSNHILKLTDSAIEAIPSSTNPHSLSTP